MPSIELIVLGLLFERPKSAYEIDKDVEYRNLSRWVKISSPSVYKKVLGLCQKGYLTSEIVRESKLPEKTVYTITPLGKHRFNSLLVKQSESEVNLLFDFNAVVANLNKVEPEKALALIANMKQSIGDTKAFLEQMRPQRAHIPLVGRAVLDQQIAVAGALYTWALEFEEQFKMEIQQG